MGKNVEIFTFLSFNYDLVFTSKWGRPRVSTTVRTHADFDLLHDEYFGGAVLLQVTFLTVKSSTKLFCHEFDRNFNFQIFFKSDRIDF